MTESSESRPVTPAQAVAIYKSIRRHGDAAWGKWIELGTWIGERTATAAAKAHATRGTIYARQLERALGQFYETYKKLSDNGTVSYLGRCMANLEAINAFRNRTPDEDERPSHPRRMWEAFEASQRSTIEFKDEDVDDDSDEGEDKPARRRVARTHNSEKELLAEIEALRERLSEHEMTIYPETNADRIWRRLVETLGHNERAGELAVRTAEMLAAIGRRIVEGQREWNASGAGGGR